MGCTSSSVPADKPALAKPQQKEEGVKASNAIQSNNFTGKYQIGEVLGKGAFSTVRLATSKEDQKKWAAKVVDKLNLPKEDNDSLRSEVKILQMMKHDNIVTCKDFFEEAKSFYLVLEFMEGGELFDRIVQKTYYNEKEAKDLVVILLSAIKYCHDRNIVHRDLKPENLLLTSKKDDADVKIADFGFAVECADETLTARCGTPGYVAPEILEGEKYGKAVDMWSIGVITYIILGGYPPFHDDNQKALFRKIRKAEFEFHPEYWEHVSEEAKDLIKGMLTKDPKKRLTAAQAVVHPWLMTEDSMLSARNLDSNLKEFKRFHATRKFRAAAKALIAIKKMGLLMEGAAKESQKVESEKDAEKETTQKDDENILLKAGVLMNPSSNELEEVAATEVDDVKVEVK
eukprot:CAMPEP_0119034050 /NCGR_PEP_ID=MMETSP1177-20130426/1100_1 /TAXON_ID=2985 /ORGANISM="Ochromonas sp, Strain CCMP1899" /LENGTH=400 /DNA_ID=CAMNT_0006991251 /DNA_START=71 /DNA_END=1273 /DNA_ORIENTATION=+